MVVEKGKCSEDSENLSKFVATFFPSFKYFNFSKDVF